MIASIESHRAQIVVMTGQLAIESIIRTSVRERAQCYVEKVIQGTPAMIHVLPDQIHSCCVAVGLRIVVARCCPPISAFP